MEGDKDGILFSNIKQTSSRSGNQNTYSVGHNSETSNQALMIFRLFLSSPVLFSFIMKFKNRSNELFSFPHIFEKIYKTNKLYK